MKKRENSRLYEKKITLGRDPEGNPIRKSIYAKTKAELEEKVFKARQEYITQTPSFTPSDEISFATFCRKWVITEKSGFGLNTVRIYHYYANVVEKFFGELLLSDLTQDNLRELIAAYLNRPNAVKKLRQFLALVISDAEEKELIPKGKLAPSKIPVPTMKRASKRRSLTEDEKRALFTADLTDRERSFILMLYFTGLRKEEALALTPEAIDLNKKTVTVSQVRVEDMYSVAHIIPTAKNATSLRSVPLPDKYINMYSDYLRGCTGLIWTEETNPGKAMTDASYECFFAKIKKKLSMVCPSCAELTAHMFRHNYATMLYYSNISIKMAAKLLGHSSVDMIMKVYAHLDEQKENAAEKLNAVFSSD